MLCLSVILCVLRPTSLLEGIGGDIVAPAGDEGPGAVRGRLSGVPVAPAGDGGG